MLEFSVCGVKVRVGFGFFAAVMFYFYACDEDTLGVAAVLTCCLLHELGHLSAMFLFGCPPERLTLYAGGFMLTKSFDKQCGRGGELVILAAGCAVNFILAAVSALFGAKTLVSTNLSLAFVNLLPFSSLDGGRMLALFGTRVRKAAAAVTMLTITAAALYSGITPAAMMAISFAAASEISG